MTEKQFFRLGLLIGFGYGGVLMLSTVALIVVLVVK